MPDIPEMHVCILLFIKFRIGCCSIYLRCVWRDVRRLMFALECTALQLPPEVRVLGPCQLCARMGQRLDLSAVCPHMPVPMDYLVSHAV